MWTPLSVSMGCEISPTLRAKAASSNGFCIEPRPNGPRSPLRLAELQSLYFPAKEPKLASPETICSLYADSQKSNYQLFF